MSAMNSSYLLILLALAAYLIGSVPFAVLVSRAFGLSDPRKFGSGNPGATNVLRSGNKLAALLTLIGDAGKGWLAVFLVTHLDLGISVDETLIATVAFAVFLGHVFPVFLNFRGGKGVATAAGVLLALDIWLGLSVMAVWLLTAVIFRYSSLAALIAAAAAPLITLIVLGSDARMLAVTGLSLLLIYRHRDNLARLRSGTEGKLGKKKAVDNSTNPEN